MNRDRDDAPPPIEDNGEIGDNESNSSPSLSQITSQPTVTFEHGEYSRQREYEFSSRNRSESGHQDGGSASMVDQDAQPRRKKKRYHRHTQVQIQEMETFFKECPHPDDRQRKELGRQLGLQPLQVKFWFQNKRTQMKTQHERHENAHLRAENERLRAENIRCREALIDCSCLHCGGTATSFGDMSYEEEHLRLENLRLKQEIDRVAALVAKHAGKGPLHYHPPRHAGLFVGGLFVQPSVDLLKSLIFPTESDKPMIIDLAVSAMEELVRIAQMGEPLWRVSLNGGITVLDEDEYVRTFPRGIGPKPSGFKCEATMETAVVPVNHLNLVEILMDVNQWATVFSAIVCRAATVDVLSNEVAGNYNGAMKVMAAEYQVPTPVVPSRDCYFVRYCKSDGEGTWAVVDVSLDNLRPQQIANCRRRPSGCLIQEMPNGCSKVVWVEHVEVDDRRAHNLYKQLLSSGHGFGAKRWLATLDRQCQRLDSGMATYIPTVDGGVIPSQEGRESLLKLSERMVVSFCGGVGASTAHIWSNLSGSADEDVRVMTRKNMDDPSRPRGIVLTVATSFWIPLHPKKVFDFLRDENSRKEWDVLCTAGAVQEIAHIAHGGDTGNCVSILRINAANSTQTSMMILQETMTDPTGSYVIYAPLDSVAMSVVLNGGDPDYIALLPSGFAILPDGSDTVGSLLTVAFQILVDSVPTAKLSLGSIAAVNSLISCTAERIRSSLLDDESLDVK